MRRVLFVLTGLLCAAGAISLALAQGAIPVTTPTPPVCATPIAASPIAGASPQETAPVPLGTPAGCNLVNSAPVIEAYDLGFRPNVLTIPANTALTLTLRNDGVALHNFSLDALRLSQNLLPGETRTVTLVVPPGDYPFYCAIPGHKEAGMVGLLIAR